MALLADSAGSLVAPPGWGEVALLAVFAVACTWAGVRVWQGTRVNSRSTLEDEDRLAFLTVTCLPAGVMFSALTVVELLAQVAGHAEHAAGFVVLVIQSAVSVIAFIAGIVGVSLGVLGRPKLCVPPRLRDDL